MTTPTEYEQFVRDIMETLLKAQGLTTVKVEHDVLLKGLSREHQIDVYWEYRLGGVTHKVIINCKRYKNDVEVTHVETLNGVLADFPGHRGLIITTKGFQSGAIQYAKTHAIGLKVIRPAREEDYEGFLRSVEVNLTLQTPRCTAISPVVDQTWAEANLTPEQMEELRKPSPLNGHDSYVDDVMSGKQRTLNEIFNEMGHIADGKDHTSTLEWGDAYLVTPGRPRVRLKSLSITYDVTFESRTFSVGGALAKAIVRDAIEGTLLFVDDAGAITGDTAAELGS